MCEEAVTTKTAGAVTWPPTNELTEVWDIFSRVLPSLLMLLVWPLSSLFLAFR